MVKKGKACEAQHCHRTAVCTAFVRDEVDYADSLEEEEGTPL